MNSKMSLKEHIVPLKEFRENTESYIARLAKGESFLVMKRSRPVFMLNPVGHEWETIGDFGDMRGGGVSGKVLLKKLQ